MLNILCVGLGGFLGAISRYLISMYSSKMFISKIPVGTLIVNILGGLLIGIIMQLNIKTNLISEEMKLFLTTGLMGGLTTFSTFSYETITLINKGYFSLALMNIILNLVLSLTGVIIGQRLIK